jgi:hypothetical protein
MLRAKLLAGMKKKHYPLAMILVGLLLIPHRSCRPIAGVTVRVVKDGIDLATKETDGPNSAKQCRRGLSIRLVLSYLDNCGSYVVGMKRMA